MKCLVYDHGHNLELALALALDKHEVAYYVPPSDKYWDQIYGQGFEREGLVKVPDFFPRLDYSDAIFFFGASSHFDGNLVEWLRHKDYKVWGAGNSERLESDRWHAKQVQDKAHLPVQGVKHVQGVPALLKELQQVTNKVVKVSKFRDVETFSHDNWKTTEAQFVGELLTKYGTDPNIEFLVEDKIESTVEPGSDDLVVNGQVATSRGYGYENKDDAYIGKFGAELPPLLDKTFRGMQPAMKGCTSFVSLEVRGGFLTDVTMRAPHPPTAAIMQAYTNLPAFLVNGALGQLGQLVTYNGDVVYAASLVLKSTWSLKQPLKVEFPASIRPFVKLLNAFKRGNDYWVAPGHDEIVGYVSYRATGLKNLVASIHTLADQVKAKDLYCDHEALDELLEKTIPEGRQSGIPF